jgi:hypothetical protein
LARAYVDGDSPWQRQREDFQYGKNSQQRENPKQREGGSIWKELARTALAWPPPVPHDRYFRSIFEPWA